MGIQTTGCEIIGILKEFTDDDPADSHHASLARQCLFGVGTAPEEQSRGTQEQIFAVEVISTIDEGRLGEHLRAALPVRRERFPASILVFAPWSVLLDWAIVVLARV